MPNVKLSALWKLDPDKAVQIVTEAFSKASGHIGNAAKALDVGRTSILRWMEEYPQLKINLEEIRKEVEEDELQP